MSFSYFVSGNNAEKNNRETQKQNSKNRIHHNQFHVTYFWPKNEIIFVQCWNDKNRAVAANTGIWQDQQKNSFKQPSSPTIRITTDIEKRVHQLHLLCYHNQESESKNITSSGIHLCHCRPFHLVHMQGFIDGWIPFPCQFFQLSFRSIFCCDIFSHNKCISFMGLLTLTLLHILQ